ncbi:choice-of-anchor P family protein [Actinomadura madurae]|uniref:choice-of-anchor P family protein n=1 Tax=Actinomadura madurae TaxID=1993 RepID=UPI0020D22036|nr:choice-of-anchor P family protein [Actinomadura madurae]MCQ0007420.1 choice-of-anchor P family protein [Actinomadura madurae]
MRHTHLAKRLATTGLLAAGLAAPAAPALASAPALAATPGGEGSAYGLTVTGPVAVPPVPAVASRTGTVSKSLLRENRTGLVSASALDVKASAARASSTVARLAVPKAKLLASAVSAKCTAGRGSAHLAHAVLAGPPAGRLAAAEHHRPRRRGRPRPDVPGPQQAAAHGRRRLAVTAMELNLPGGKGAVRVASATCGRAKAPAEAPAPTPVEHDLPVTG